MQKRIRSRKNPEAEKAEGTGQPLKAEKPREEGAEAYKAQEEPRARESWGYKKPLKAEKPREEGAEAYKEQKRPRSGSNSKNHKNIKNKSI